MNKPNVSQKRILDLVSLNQDVFSIDDLARIWQINNRHNLYITLGRYVRGGLLIKIYRGLYSLKSVDKLDPLVLGCKAINNYCYVSTESVLANHGVIFQELSYYTFISSKNNRIKIENNSYYVRQLKDAQLFNTIGIEKKGNVYIASLERAVADMLHYNPNYYFDNFKIVNLKKLKEIQISLGYKTI
jgi:hypothetical protein